MTILEIFKALSSWSITVFNQKIDLKKNNKFYIKLAD